MRWFVAGWDNKPTLNLKFRSFPAPPLSEQHAGVALSALIRALDQLDMVAIVRYAYDRRSNPQVGAAVPCVKQHYEVRSPVHDAVFLPLSVLWDGADGCLSCVSPSTVSQVCSAALHGRPQTLHVSFFGQQQKVHAIRYLRLCFACNPALMCKIATRR